MSGKVRKESRHGTRASRGGHAAPAEEALLEAQAGAAADHASATGNADHLTRGQLLHLQRTAGNQAVQRLVSVQRRPSLSGLKKVVGLGKKSAAEKASKAGVKAQNAKLATVADLEQQLSMLESATSKLVASHRRP